MMPHPWRYDEETLRRNAAGPRNGPWRYAVYASGDEFFHARYLTDDAQDAAREAAAVCQNIHRRGIVYDLHWHTAVAMTV